MRKALISVVLATLLVTMLGVPAAADPAGKADIIPLDYEVTLRNPCTEQVAPIHFTGELHVQAVPSIEAFYTDEWTHLTLKWVGRFVGEDGYASASKHFATQVVNAPYARPSHVVATEVDNNMHTADDGGKYKVSYRFHVTVVDGEAKTFTDVFDAQCIIGP